MITVKTVVKEIVNKFESDEQFRNKVLESPDFYRACVYESGVIQDPASIDGTPLYDQLLNELENWL